MNRFISTRTLAVILIVLALPGCQFGNDKKEDVLLGRWEIQQAYRNGRSTESLDELYFEFFQDGKMSTNLLGGPETTNYEVSEHELYQRDGQMDVDYNIIELTDSILVLSTSLRDYNFRFLLRRSIQEE